MKFNANLLPASQVQFIPCLLAIKEQGYNTDHKGRDFEMFGILAFEFVPKPGYFAEESAAFPYVVYDQMDDRGNCYQYTRYATRAEANAAFAALEVY